MLHKEAKRVELYFQGMPGMLSGALLLLEAPVLVKASKPTWRITA